MSAKGPPRWLLVLVLTTEPGLLLLFTVLFDVDDELDTDELVLCRWCEVVVVVLAVVVVEVVEVSCRFISAELFAEQRRARLANSHHAERALRVAQTQKPHATPATRLMKYLRRHTYRSVSFMGVVRVSAGVDAHKSWSWPGFATGACLF
jgi:hypothetical protein